MTFLVTGAAGQLGGTFVRRLAREGLPVVPCTRQDLDLTDHRSVLETVRRERPAVILNCAAYNAVDAAEDDAKSALAVNALGVHSLARAAMDVDATLVHYSTDFVFDGEASRPYREEDEANPRSVYGQSKLLGEWLALDAPRAFVLRVESLFGGPAARSSIDRIVDALVDGRPVRVFTDRTVSPSYVEDVVDATLALLRKGAAPGLYHCVNGGVTTWHELALAAAELLGCEPQLEPVRLQDVQLRAARPRYCALSNERLAAAGASMPPWRDALARYLRVRSGQSAP